MLITGGSGLLALNWACAVRDSWDVILGTHQRGVALRGASSVRLNLENPDELGRQLEEIRPDLVVHTAGFTNVDGCEADPIRARLANTTLAEHVVVATRLRSIRLIHISTDHLFPGDRPFTAEEDPPHPINEYGRSKLRAEELVLQHSPDALVLRTNFFGWGHAHRQSFSDWIIFTLRAGRPLTAFDDVYFTPILADHLALTAHELVRAGESGLFNVAGDERRSKYEFARLVAQEFDLPADLIKRALVETAGLGAPRPPDMSLDTAKVRRALSRERRSLDQHLKALRAQETEGRRAELSDAVV